MMFLLLGLPVLFGPPLAWTQRLGTGAGSAVSSEATATQPRPPELPPVPSPTEGNPQPETGRPIPVDAPIDPLLDPAQPRNCQLTMAEAQTVACGQIQVELPAGLYKQILIMENPQGRRAMDTTQLRRQQVGLGYIRYLSDTKLKVNGQERIGGLDVGIRSEDSLPVRIWYRKMTDPDGATRALVFILPPVALLAGAGAWSSGNILLPDTPPQFTEARDYFLREPPQEESLVQPAFRSRPAEPKTEPGARANR